MRCVLAKAHAFETVLQRYPQESRWCITKHAVRRGMFRQVGLACTDDQASSGKFPQNLKFVGVDDQARIGFLPQNFQFGFPDAEMISHR